VAGPTELLDALAHVAGACHRRRRGGRARRAAGLAEGPPNGGHPVRARVADDAMALEPRPVVAKMAPAASQEVARYGGNGAIRSARARPFRNAVSTLSVGSLCRSSRAIRGIIIPSLPPLRGDSRSIRDEERVRCWTNRVSNANRSWSAGRTIS
jgi:hypothetical protein